MLRALRTHCRLTTVGSAMGLLALACNGEGAVRPSTRQAALVRAALTSASGNNLLLADNSRLLVAARADPDSAAIPVSVATVHLTGQPGDTVSLLLRAAPELLSAAGGGVRLLVDIDGTRAEYSLPDLVAGVTIHRFAEARTIAIDYLLSREVETAGDGAFDLRQPTSAALVSKATPWVLPAAAAVQHLAAVCGTDCAETCPLSAATGTCGPTTWTIEPYVVPDVFGSFQSDEGHGQSHPITITFTEPIASITITIEDPTWAGNFMTAYAPDGQVVGTVDFAYNSTPGTNAPDTKTISGAISRVVLTPPIGDYVAYDGTITVRSQLTVTCVPASLVRGETVTCTTTATDGSEFAPTHLTSTTTDGRPIFDADVDSKPLPQFAWRGPAIMSTSIMVTGTADGKQVTGTGSFSVAPRIGRVPGWMDESFSDDGFPVTPPDPTYVKAKPLSGDYPGFTITGNGYGAPEAGLGLTVYLYPFSPKYAQVKAGPNAGLVFVTNVPWRADERANAPVGIYLRTSVQSSDPFYKRQIGPSPWCTLSDMAAIHSVLLTHEDRHWTTARDYLSPLDTQRKLEEITLLPGESLDQADATFVQVRTAYANTVTASNNATHAVPDNYPACDMRP